MSASFTKENVQTETSAEDKHRGSAPFDNEVDVDVNVREAIGIMILGFLFFIVLMAMLRSQKRERKLLEEVARLRAQVQKHEQH
jgi:hypothetical protein